MANRRFWMVALAGVLTVAGVDAVSSATVARAQITRAPSFVFAGRVVDEMGAPVPDVLVFINYRQQGRAAAGATRSSSTGTFSLTAPSPRIEAEVYDDRDGTVQLPLVGAVEHRAVLTLARGAPPVTLIVRR